MISHSPDYFDRYNQLKYKTAKHTYIFQPRTTLKKFPLIVDNNSKMKTQNNNKIKFFVYQGNNSELVTSIFSKRDYLISGLRPSASQVIWRPFSQRADFDRHYELFNHIEGHEYLTRKELMFVQITSYCKLKNIDSNSFIPKTFIVNINANIFETHKKLIAQLPEKYWLFKPPDLNRGSGIKIIKTLDDLLACIQMYRNSSELPNLGFVIVQEYLSRPLLINKRKFDIRMWMLFDHKRHYYQFREGYLRMSGVEFSLNDESIQNLYIHLTNNAVQKSHYNYGHFEKGNQLSFSDLKDYLYEQNLDGEHILKQIIKRTREIMQLAVRSVRNKLNIFNKQHQFEIMGFDFMIDQSFQVWLIEINTNPCIELSSPLLQLLIPRMLNDAFRITIDQIYKSDQDKLLSQFKVDPYPNESNLWQYNYRISNFRDYIGTA